MNPEADFPAIMFSDGSMIVHTQNQANCFECPKAPYVVRMHPKQPMDTMPPMQPVDPMQLMQRREPMRAYPGY